MSEQVLIGCRVSPETRKALAALAASRDRSIAGEIRHALAAHMRAAAAEAKEGSRAAA